MLYYNESRFKISDMFRAHYKGNSTVNNENNVSDM